MKKPVQIVIPEPCSESWNEMSPEGSGRFCGKCEKTVVDFTGMSSLSVLNFLENSPGVVCGRIRPSQMLLYPVSGTVYRQEFSLRAVVLGLALTTFCALHGSAQQDVIQGGISVEQVETTDAVAGKDSLEYTVVAHDEAGNPLAYTVVYVTYDDDTFHSFQADSMGIVRFWVAGKVKSVYADNGVLQSNIYTGKVFDGDRQLVAVLHDFNPPVMGKMILPRKSEKE